MLLRSLDYYLLVLLSSFSVIFMYKPEKRSQYKLKRCSKKKCCKQCRYVKFKSTMTKWSVQKPTHRTTQKHVEHQDATDIWKKHWPFCQGPVMIFTGRRRLFLSLFHPFLFIFISFYFPIVLFTF